MSAERIQSLVRSFTDSSIKPFGDGFNMYVYLMTIVSLLGAFIYIIYTNPSFFLCPFTFDSSIHASVDMGKLCIAAGIILLSGMVHTEHTIAPVQFGAYGALIVAMVLHTINVQGASQNKFLLWFSLVYLTAFSMAIPVVYRSEIKHNTLFHIIEAATAVLLVGMFTYMLVVVFTGNATNLFYVCPIVAVAVLDGILLFMRRTEQLNTFVLIFAITSVVLWIVGRICASVMH